MLSNADGVAAPLKIGPHTIMQGDCLERLREIPDGSVDLCEYLVSKFSDEGQTVLDPFMGSGTTGVACARTGRNFIGIELDPTYYLTSAMRIAAEVGL